MDMGNMAQKEGLGHFGKEVFHLCPMMLLIWRWGLRYKGGERVYWYVCGVYVVAFRGLAGCSIPYQCASLNCSMITEIWNILI
jgi:hypothetical protein